MATVVLHLTFFSLLAKSFPIKLGCATFKQSYHPHYIQIIRKTKLNLMKEKIHLLTEVLAGLFWALFSHFRKIRLFQKTWSLPLHGIYDLVTLHKET